MAPVLLDERPVALTFRSRLFNASEGFVQAQAAGLTRYQPLVAGLKLIGNVDRALSGRLVLPSSRTERLRFQLLGDVAAMAARLAHFRPRVLHAHFGTDGLLALPLARALGVPLVTTLRGYDVNLSRGTLLRSGRPTWMTYALRRRRLMESGEIFLAVSDFLRARAIAAGYPEHSIFTHYNGVDLEVFRAGPGEREDGLVLHVANLVTKKGTAQLIRAFAEVRREVPDARLAILGEGPLEPALRRQAAEAAPRSAIHFAGHRSREEVAAWMRRACVLAVPSVTGSSGDAEGLPNVVVEAAAAGLPVVATRHAGIPEAVAADETGILVPEKDHGALVAALTTLLQAPELRNRMGDAARRRAVLRFDAARQMARLECCYDNLGLRRARPGKMTCADVA
jgi:glycosyltransferase involved in cell wall biosynthesis